MSLTITRQDPVEIAACWQDLLALSQTNNVFATPQWKQLWWQEFGAGKEMELLAFGNGRRCVGLAPLVKEGDVFRFLGGADVSDYLDLVTIPGTEQEVYSALLDYLRTRDWRQIDLHNLPQHSQTWSTFAALAQAAGFRVLVEQETVCPTIELPDDWESYLASLSKKNRHELRRKLRRLQGAGRVSYYVANDLARISNDMEDFFRLHMLSAPEKAEFMTGSMKSFFRGLAETFLPLGTFKLYFMEFEGVRVSSALCFDQAATRHLYNSGYDPAYASLSVGLLLKAFCIRDAIEAGLEWFDCLRGPEPYKYDLGAKDTPIYRCLIEKP